MNPRQFALFLGFYFYVLNVNAANDAQRVILLSSLIQIRALQAQLLLWNQHPKILRFTELTDRFTARKTIFVCCSQKVVLRGRTTSLLKICLRRQVFVCVETSRSHLAWSTDDRNLTDFFGYQNKLV